MNKKYVVKLAAKGISQSMSRKGNCYDSGIMESFIGVMKNEMYYGLEDSYKSFAEFKKNSRRIHRLVQQGENT